MIAIMSRPLDALWNASGPTRRLVEGEVLFRTGEPVRHVYRVEEGEIRLARLLPQRSELTIQRARDGDVLAEASLYAAAYHCDAVAILPTRVRSAPISRAVAMLAGDAEVALAFMRHLAIEVQSARARAEIVSLRTVSERLDAWLAFRDGDLPPRGQWRDVAGEIGVSPEALYRELAARRATATPAR